MEMEYEDVLDAAVDFPTGLSCALEMFREKDIVLSYIRELPDIFRDRDKVEASYEKYMKILDRYQEQPHLLDSSLKEIIDACLQIVRSSSAHFQLESSTSGGTVHVLPPGLMPSEHLSLKYLRHVFKVRGHKKATQLMPHEVSDLTSVLQFLESIDFEDVSLWESAVIMIYWLSILVINPFDLKVLDSQSTSVVKDKFGQSIPIVQRIMDVCMKCIVLSNGVGQAVPLLISKFLTRPDMMKRDPPFGTDSRVYDLETFITWCCENLVADVAFGTRRGAFLSLAALLDNAKREDILKYGRKMLVALLASDYSGGDTLIRKLGTKLMQRVGALFLRAKTAPWRYNRGVRRLIDNLQPEASKNNLPDTNQNTLPSNEDSEEENSNQYDEVSQYSDELESVLDKLLRRLDDKDTVVRWSAAKGIARMVTKLPKDYGNEVVESVLQLFTPRSSSGAWQGGCLALAELARRGLLLPERLRESIPVIQKALLYDEVRCNFSVGCFVRDAACYVFWALARAFEPHILQPYVNDLASSLIVTMVFDREVNCRRAASAAFQENVGRQRNFPNGMDIVTIGDYQNVGNRTNAFTKVSVQIAAFPAYTRPLIDHLIEYKFNHFDPSIRELTATTLAGMAHLDSEYILYVVMNKLLPIATENDIATSHGAIFCLSSVMAQLSSLGLFRMEGNNKIDIRNIALSIVERQLRPNGLHYRIGHELLREALNYHIKCCAQSKLPFHDDKELLETWYAVLEDNVSFCESSVRTSAADALPLFLHEYFYIQPGMRNKVGEFVNAFCENLNSNVMTTRIGYAHALGKLPLNLVIDSFPNVISSLVQCARSTGKHDAAWAESRREATAAIANILSYNIANSSDDDWKDGIPFDIFDYTAVWEQLINNMSDYTTDKRGDIGSWVREAAMSGIKELMIGLRQYEVKTGVALMSPSQYTYLLGLICKQCVEKIDNLRVHAGNIFAAILHHPLPFDIAHRDALREVFPEEACASMHWRSSSVTFPKFAHLIAFPEYSIHLLSGFIISGGSLSDTVLQDATNAVQRYLDNSDQTEVRRISEIMVEIFKENQKVERISVPLMKFWTLLLRAGIFYDILSDHEKAHFGLALTDCIKAEILKCNKVDKIIVGVEVLTELMQSTPEVVTSCLKRLVVLLCHTYPRVRIVTSQKIYEALATYGETMDIECDKQVEAMNLLRSTIWQSPLQELHVIRNNLCSLLGVPVPLTVVPSFGEKREMSATDVTA